ncbi:MAG: response regulator [Gemmatimonadaceae bacterium]
MNVTNQPILLVEDDENDVMLLQRAFRRAAIINPLQVVRHGDDAVAYLAGTGEFADRQLHPLPVLMLLDLKLPRRTGLEVLQWVKERAGVKKIPIIVLTSSKNDDDVNRAYELGANSYVVKPVSFETLLELVKSLELYWLVLNERPNITA